MQSSDYSIELDTIPYLKWPLDIAGQVEPSISISRLSTCLSELDLALNQTSRNSVDLEQLACLQSIISRLRNHLRSSIADDLERFASIRLSYNSSSSQHHHLNSITSRNSIDDDFVGLADQQRALQQHSSREPKFIDDPSGDSNPSTADVTPNTNTNTIGRAYREALGSALGIVVGSGLLILVLNLLIVLLIAFRARANRRNANSSDNSNPSGEEISVRQFGDTTNKRKSTLKQATRQTQSESHENHIGARKQLKFDLADDPADFLDKSAHMQLPSPIQIFPLVESQFEPHEFALGQVPVLGITSDFEQHQTSAGQLCHTICNETDEQQSWSQQQQQQYFGQPEVDTQFHSNTCPLRTHQATQGDLYSPESSTSFSHHSMRPNNATIDHYPLVNTDRHRQRKFNQDSGFGVDSSQLCQASDNTQTLNRIVVSNQSCGHNQSRTFN